MEIVLRVFQVFLAIGLIGVVLLQRSEGGGLGIGSSGGAGSFMSVRGTANFLTRVTAILAALFMLTCLSLALLAKPNTAPKSIFDVPGQSSKAALPAEPAQTPSDTLPSSLPAPTEKPLSSQLPAPAAPVTTPAAPLAVPPPAAPQALVPATKPGGPIAPATQDKKAPQTGTAHTPGQ
jgi:preprotein translocase subunit SecG